MSSEELPDRSIAPASSPAMRAAGSFASCPALPPVQRQASELSLDLTLAPHRLHNQMALIHPKWQSARGGSGVVNR
jgi:hypothetical protein